MKLYCLAPFTSPSVTPEGFKICSSPCQKSFKSIDFWNGEYTRGIRKQWMNDDIPAECKDCFYGGSATIVSPDPSPMAEYVPLNFEQLYLARSNKCDYACEMCSADISHTYDKVFNDGKLGILENDFDLSPYLGDTKKIAISGGNPPLDSKIPDIINQLDNNKLDRFLITTNGSVFPDKLLNIIIDKEFKCDIDLIFSMDGPKVFNEKVRRGAKQEKIYKTVKDVYRKVEHLDNFFVDIEFTATSKSVHYLIDLYKEMKQNFETHMKIYMIGNVCTYPANLALHNVDKATYDHMRNHVKPYFFRLRKESHLGSQFYALICNILEKMMKYYEK
jgi:sulfatase maturation enzyme AslB (radical SAM superfamily)